MNKSEIREEIFKLVYSLEVQSSSEENQIDVFLEASEIDEKSKENVKAAAQKILEHKYNLEEEIGKNLKSDWTIDRISKIDVSILKVAIYEIIYQKLPYKISINEAVEIAKKYGEDSSPSFVNGILASVVKENNLAEE